MDEWKWIHKLFNICLPPIVLALMLLISPFLLLYRSVSFIFKSFRHRENVAGKVVLITGSSSGIGEHMAYEYAKRGARLALVARRNDRLLSVAEKARHLGSPETLVICADVSKYEDCRRFVEETVNHFGQLDHLVNNAGTTHIGLFKDATDFSDGRRVMDTNFWGNVYCAHFAAPHLRKTKGKLIATLSGFAFISYPKFHFYCASKAASKSFIETLKLEFGSDIEIVMVFPGLIKSEMTSGDIISQAGGNFVPIESADACAKKIVGKVCRGHNFIIEPSWTRAIYWGSHFYDEFYAWFCRWILINNTSSYTPFKTE